MGLRGDFVGSYAGSAWGSRGSHAGSAWDLRGDRVGIAWGYFGDLTQPPPLSMRGLEQINARRL